MTPDGGGLRIFRRLDNDPSCPGRQRSSIVATDPCMCFGEGVRCERDPEIHSLWPIVVRNKTRLDEVISADLAILVLAVLDRSSAVSDGSNLDVWANGKPPALKPGGRFNRPS